MFSITAPKVVFCDVDVYDLVYECLQELESDASVFTFGGTADESISVEQLFEETPEEKEFSWAIHSILNGIFDLLKQSFFLSV